MKTILLLFSFSIVLVASQQQQWPPCIDSNYTGTIIPRPDNYSAVCLDVNEKVGVCSYSTNGSTSFPERNAGCYDGDTCTDDICTFCDCFHDVNCTFCQVGEWHCGCVFIPKDDCCNYDHQCDIGGSCTTGTCVDHACVITPDPNCCQEDSDCNDNIECTVDTCVQNQCTYVENNSLCPPLVIGDSQCSWAICSIEEQGCITTILQDGTPCDDGSMCTTNDTCCSGVCKSSGRLSCSDGDLCTRDICDDQVGCIHLCIDPHTISKDLVGNNSFICPCCQDCDCLVPSSLDSFGYYTQARCILVELQQPLNLSSTSLSFFNHESGTKMRKCMCDPNQGGCIASSVESAKETYPYSGHAACVVNSNIHANNDLPVIFKKRQQLLATFSPAMLAIQHQTLAVLDDVYKCVLRASAEWTRNISQPGPNESLVVGPSVYGFNESLCDSTRNDTCLPGFFCALAGQYSGTPFGNVTIVSDVCFPLFAIGETCLGNNTLANNTVYPNVGSGGCSRSQCNGTVCVANPPISCFPNNYTLGEFSFYSDCGDGADGIALQCINNTCTTCNNNNNDVCAIVTIENDNTTTVTPLNSTCCSGYACPILSQPTNGFGVGSSFNVFCTACFQQGNRSFEKTHPVCTSDLQCCPPHSYCIDIRPSINNRKRAESSGLANARGCAACAISSESCDSESSNHTINSTGVCCPGLACHNGKCIKRCTCAAECVDNDPTTMDDCNHEGLCCHTAPAPTPAPTTAAPTPAPTPTPGPSSTIPFRDCVGCQSLGTYLSTVGVFTALIYFEQPLYGESYVVNGGGAGIDVVVLNAVNGPSDATNNNFTFTNTTSIITGYTNSSLVSQIFLDAQQLYSYLYSCTPVQNEGSFDAFMSAGGASLSTSETIRFQTPQVINSAFQYSSFKSPLFDTVRFIFQDDLTINNGAGVLQPNQLADMCHVYWIVYGNLIVNTWMLHGNFIVHGTVTLNAANATLLNNTVGGIVRGRIITTSGFSVVTISGLWKFDQCNCTECGNRASLVCDPLDPYSCCNEPGLNCINSYQNDTRCCRTLSDFCINNTECCAYTTNPGGSNKCVGGVCQSCVTFQDREKQCDENADCCQPYTNSSFVCIPSNEQTPAICCMPSAGQCNSTNECCPSNVCVKPILGLPGTCTPCVTTGGTCSNTIPCCRIDDGCKNEQCCRSQGDICASTSDCCAPFLCNDFGECDIPAQLVSEPSYIVCDYEANLTTNCCGNNVIDQGEECDLGISNRDDKKSKCSSSCKSINGIPTATIVGSLLAGVLVCCCFALCCCGVCAKFCGIGQGSKSKRSETTSKGRRNSRSSLSRSSSLSRNTSRSFSENNNYNPSKSTTSYLHYD